MRKIESLDELGEIRLFDAQIEINRKDPENIPKGCLKYDFYTYSIIVPGYIFSRTYQLRHPIAKVTLSHICNPTNIPSIVEPSSEEVEEFGFTAFTAGDYDPHNFHPLYADDVIRTQKAIFHTLEDTKSKLGRLPRKLLEKRGRAKKTLYDSTADPGLASNYLLELIRVISH